MRTLLSYECEICGTEYSREDDALACEAQGLPEPMPFLPWDLPIPVFGERGVKYCRLVEARVGCFYRTHEWWLRTDPYVHVSHNIEGNLVPGRAFDPRFGWDAFRYDVSNADLNIWSETLKAYGFSEQDVDAYLLSMIQQERRRLAKSEAPVVLREHANLVPAESLVRRSETG